MRRGHERARLAESRQPAERQQPAHAPRGGANPVQGDESAVGVVVEPCSQAAAHRHLEKGRGQPDDPHQSTGHPRGHLRYTHPAGARPKPRPASPPPASEGQPPRWFASCEMPRSLGNRPGRPAPAAGSGRPERTRSNRPWRAWKPHAPTGLLAWPLLSVCMPYRRGHSSPDPLLQRARVPSRTVDASRAGRACTAVPCPPSAPW